MAMPAMPESRAASRLAAHPRRLLLLATLLFGTAPAQAVETPWWGYARGWFSSLFAPKANTPVLGYFGVDAKGTARGPADYRGRVLLLTFWASWCPNCRVEMPQLAQLASAMPKDRFGVVAINVYDSREKMDQFIRQSNFDFSYLYDASGSVVTSFGISAIPVLMLVDSHGTIVRTWRGSLPMDEVRQQVNQALAQAEPPKSPAHLATNETWTAPLR